MFILVKAAASDTGFAVNIGRVLASVGFLSAFLLTADAAPVPAPPPLESLNWLPANTVAITGAPRDQVSLLKWLRDTPKTFPGMGAKPLPACWDRVTNPSVGSGRYRSGRAGAAKAL